MTEDVEFLFDNQLIAALENLIRNSKRKLLLVSPYIDLDPRITDALNEKKSLHNFELKVLFGKNENNYLKSIKKDSLKFLMEFPNVEIRYNERLHAKFYQNDIEYIMTSLNLYDYSLANNIEVGVRCEFGLKGIVGKTIDASFSAIGEGVNKVKQEVLGMDKKIGPLEKFKIIFESSELKYKTEPVVEERSGLQGLIGMKKLADRKVVVDNLSSSPVPQIQMPTVETSSVTTEVQVTVNTKVVTNVQRKCVSASQLAKSLGLQTKDVTSLMQRLGFIAEDRITAVGKAKGLVMKNYMGNDYIAYPDDLEELNELRKN